MNEKISSSSIKIPKIYRKNVIFEPKSQKCLLSMGLRALASKKQIHFGDFRFFTNLKFQICPQFEILDKSTLFQEIFSGTPSNELQDSLF